MIRLALYTSIIALVVYAVIGFGTAAESTVKQAHAQRAACIEAAEMGQACER